MEHAYEHGSSGEAGARHVLDSGKPLLMVATGLVAVLPAAPDCHGAAVELTSMAPVPMWSKTHNHEAP